MAKRVEIRCTPQMLAEMVVAPEPPEADTPESIAREELAHALLAHLSERQREAVQLRMAGYSYSQAAEALGISVRSVRVREERGMARLREVVAQNPSEYFLP